MVNVRTKFKLSSDFQICVLSVLPCPQGLWLTVKHLHFFPVFSPGEDKFCEDGCLSLHSWPSEAASDASFAVRVASFNKSQIFRIGKVLTSCLTKPLHVQFRHSSLAKANSQSDQTAVGRTRNGMNIFSRLAGACPFCQAFFLRCILYALPFPSSLILLSLHLKNTGFNRDAISQLDDYTFPYERYNSRVSIFFCLLILVYMLLDASTRWFWLTSSVCSLWLS